MIVKQISLKREVWLLIVLMVLMSSCTKRDVGVLKGELPEMLKNTKLPLQLNNDYANVIFDIGEKIALRAAGNVIFRKYIYKKIDERFDGDYNVLIKDLISPIVGNDSLIKDNLSFLQNSNKGHLHLYIPFYEELKTNNAIGKDAPIIVFNSDDKNEAIYDGYRVGKSGRLSKVDFSVSEDFARKNEVWVLGFNERVGSLNNFVSVDRDSLSSGVHSTKPLLAGPTVYIEKLRIPDLGAVESWTNGKIELVARVFGRNSGQILEYSYGKIRRKYLKKGKWYERMVRVFDWDTKVSGLDIIVQWTELDGGDKSTTNTISFPAANGYPAISHSYTTKEDDDNLGYQLIQYSNLITKPDLVYNTGLIQWKMTIIF